MAEAAKAEVAAKPDSKAGAGAAAEDLSMEEILHSIRKIIAEDDTDTKTPNGKTKPEASAAAPTSDVLELTEMLKEDGSVESLKPENAPTPPDVLKTIDQALTPEKAAEKEKPAEKPAEKAEEKPSEKEKPVEKVAEKAEEKPVEKPAETPAPAAAAPVVIPETPAPAKSPADGLLSNEAATAASTSLKTLRAAADPLPPLVVATPSPVMNSGTTVENMVMDMLRPMLKDWLDMNLPNIVQNIVEREVKKLTK